jgi:phosphoglycolate phosphatase
MTIGTPRLPRPPRARAVLFDFDGTLIDSRGDIAAACNHALTTLGRAPLPEDVIAGFVGDGARMLLARALTLPPEDAHVEQAIPLFNAFYEAHPADHTTLLPGAREALDALAGRPVGLVTNKPRGPTLAALTALGVLSRFAVVRTGSDGPLKPDPRALTAALELVGVAPADAWMVGDGDQDIRAGRAAGCFTVAVTGGFQASGRIAARGPDVVIDSLHALVPLIRAAD